MGAIEEVDEPYYCPYCGHDIEPEDGVYVHDEGVQHPDDFDFEEVTFH